LLCYYVHGKPKNKLPQDAVEKLAVGVRVQHKNARAHSYE
jgi:hypothetical protein